MAKSVINRSVKNTAAKAAIYILKARIIWHHDRGYERAEKLWTEWQNFPISKSVFWILPVTTDAIFFFSLLGEYVGCYHSAMFEYDYWF